MKANKDDIYVVDIYNESWEFLHSFKEGGKQKLILDVPFHSYVKVTIAPLLRKEERFSW